MHCVCPHSGLESEEFPSFKQCPPQNFSNCILSKPFSPKLFPKPFSPKTNIKTKYAPKLILAPNIKHTNPQNYLNSPSSSQRYDAGRGYPFTIRVYATGDRGRVLAEEIELAKEDQSEVKIASLRAGDYFGEQALMRGSYRNATIMAAPNSSLVVACLTQEKFAQLRLGELLHFAKRKAVLAPHDEEAARATNSDRDVSKTPEQAAMIREAIVNNAHLHDLLKIHPDDLEQMVRVAHRKEVRPGEIVIREGDMFAEEFFVVERGAFQFHIAQVD